MSTFPGKSSDAYEVDPPVEDYPASQPIRPSSAGARRLQKARHLAYANLSIEAVMTLIFLALGIRRGDWQLFLLTGIEVIGLGALLISMNLIRRERLVPALWWMIGSGELCLLATATLVNGTGPFLALCSILLIMITTAATLEGIEANLFSIVGILAGFLAVTFNTANAFGLGSLRLTLPVLRIFTGVFFGSLIVAFLVLVITRYITLSIQTKLLTGFLVASLIPLSIIAVLNITLTTQILSNEASQGLTIAANQTASIVETAIAENITLIHSEAIIPSLANYLSLPPAKRPGSPQEANVNLTLRGLGTKDPSNLLSYAILDLNGKSIFDTDARSLGRDESYYAYFQAALKDQFQQYNPLFFDPYTGLAQVIFAAPITDNHGQIAGVLRARYKANFFLRRLENYVDMVQVGSYPILFDGNLVRLADPHEPSSMFKSLSPLPADRLSALKDEQRLPNLPAAELSTNYPVFSTQLTHANPGTIFLANIFNGQTMYAGAVTHLKSLPWMVVYIQNRDALLAPVDRQTNLSILIIGFLGLLGGLVAILLASLQSRPIVYLTQAAQRISGGDLQTQVNIRSRDEIETLGQAFNMMTNQVRGLINNLEDRVQKRTQELGLQTQRMTYRAAQLQTVADVARAIASIQDLEQLLHLVSKLTSERFNFYHVGIFLLDEAGEFAVLRAANSDGGQRMLARQHRLKVSQSSTDQEPAGIVGFVASSGQARIATDVGRDATFFNNPDLPLTRSELALPLKRGETVIGVLDVQSVVSNAFTEEDANLFSILADQIAIAIINNRLYAETRQALTDAQNIHRSYLRQEWSRETTQRRYPGYQYTPKGVFPIQAQSTPEIEKALKTGEVSLNTAPVDHNAQAAQQFSALAVPIKLRGEIIGVIDLQETEQNRQWTPDEIAMAQSVADQIAIALENARLFEKTVRRAERERKVLEITSKIRSTNDPKEMLQTAITELQQILKASKAQVIFQTHADQPGPQPVQTTDALTSEARSDTETPPANPDSLTLPGHNGSNGNNGKNSNGGK